jgi:hypothetical protein
MAFLGVSIKRGILGESEKLVKSHFWEYGDCWQQDGHFSGSPKKRPNFQAAENRPYFQATQKEAYFRGLKNRPKNPIFRTWK